MFTCCVSSDILSSKHSIGHECYAIFIILPEQSGASNSAFNRDISTPPNTLPVLQSHPPPTIKGRGPSERCTQPSSFVGPHAAYSAPQTQ